MTEFKKARDEAADNFEWEYEDHIEDAWRLGADWAYSWVLNDEESVCTKHLKSMTAVRDANIQVLEARIENLRAGLESLQDEYREGPFGEIYNPKLFAYQIARDVLDADNKARL